MDVGTNVLFLKTSNDAVFCNMLDYYSRELAGRYCLIQESALGRFSKDYSDIAFISLGQESYYDVAEPVMRRVAKNCYEAICIPTTGKKAIGFGNIIRLVSKLSFQKLVFFHSPEIIHVVPQMSAEESEQVRKLIRQFEYELQ